MLKLNFGKEERTIASELSEMSIEQWLKISNVLADKKNGFVNKYYIILTELGVEEELIDEMSIEDLKEIFLKVKFSADEEIKAKEVLSIGERDYKKMPFNGKIYRFIENELISDSPDYNKIAAYVYKLEGQELEQHIATTKERTKRFKENLSAQDVLPIISESIKIVNEFVS